MDTFVDWPWYFLRFASNGNDRAMVDRAPITGRRWTSTSAASSTPSCTCVRAFLDQGLRDFAGEGGRAVRAPADAGHGANHIYFRKEESGRLTWFNPADVELEHDAEGRPLRARLKADGKPVEMGGMARCRSRRTTRDPQVMVDRYGADTVRCYMMFTSAPEERSSGRRQHRGLGALSQKLWKRVHEHVRPARRPAGRRRLDAARASCGRRCTHAARKSATTSAGA